MEKSREFELKVRDIGGAAELVLRGVLSESVELDASQAPSGRPLVIDTGGVTNINSLGVRNWVRFLDALCERAASVTIRRLAPVLVFQASMISTFLSRAHVETFLSPWYCPQCEHECDLEFPLQAEVPGAMPCPKCNSAMELDSDRDSYLAFRNLLPS